MDISEKFWKMAEDFVRLLHRETGHSVIVCNEGGIITCSTDESRIGDLHTGAQKIMSGEVDTVFVTAEEEAANPKIKEGYNTVIESVDGQRIGTFGIAGTLEIVKPLAKVSSVVMTSWLNELEQKEQIDLTSTRVFAGVDKMIDRSAEITSQSKTLFSDLETAAAQVVDNLNVTDDILKTIQDISSRSNILSINGTIEASRAGEKGRAFAVVAGEMREMSKGTKEAAGTIEGNLARINESMTALNQTLASFSEISDDQQAVMDETIEMISSLRTAMEELRKN